MKPNEQKREFIRLRAEGKSYSFIAETLHISKGTCTAWERELKDAIATVKREQLNELYQTYYMTKEARIEKLGKRLETINAALDGADLSKVQPEKLLELQLKYTEALKEEYTGCTAPFKLEADTVEAKDILSALGDLLERVRAGEVTAEQANRESTVITNFLRAYDTVEVKAKLTELEALIGNRA